MSARMPACLPVCPRVAILAWTPTYLPVCLPACVQVGTLAVRVGGRLVMRTLRTAADGAGALLHPPSVETCVNVLSGVVQVGITLEATLFPFLFPKGVGFWQPGKGGFGTLSKYLCHRMHQMFSCFTLYKAFLLLMYQTHQCERVSSKVKGVVVQCGWLCLE
jgi:hypothetical protein